MILQPTARLVALAYLMSLLPLGASVTINEFLAINATGQRDKDGDFSDWIELKNTGVETIELASWYLTDDPDNLTKWRLPKGTLAAGELTLVYASGKDFSSLFNSEIHANFSLNSNGEYLALVEPDGVTIASELAPAYPEQHRDISYGLAADGHFAYFTQPTPGAENGAPTDGVVGGVQFSAKRGFYNEPITLELSSDSLDATIRYTDNGKEPNLFSGKIYRGPIIIDKTTTIRARAEKAGYVSSRLKTHSYLFVNDVISQTAMSTKITEDAVYGPLIRDALLAQPAISLVTPVSAISMTAEDPTSVEMIFPDGTDGFQIDAGVKRVGGHSLTTYPKNNMRLYFRSEYGDEKLRFPLFEGHPYTDVAATEFDQLQLRSGSHDSVFYLGANQQSPSNAQYIRNRWINDMQFLMGHESLRGRWVHVYLNGIYWGHYQVMERPTQGYFASYLGGAKEDYVAVNKGLGVGSSDMTSWNAMRDSRTDFEAFKRWVDIENYVDYMLLNYYAGNDWDWNPEQNWAGGGPVLPDSGGMKFIAWDSDIIFRRLNDNNLAKGGPHSMFPSLMANDDFAMYVADRIQKHFNNDGLLTPSKVAAAYNFRAEQIRLSIIPETARWESGRWTRDNQWQAELDRLNNDFFPNRTAEVLKQFKTRGWTGAAAAPSFSHMGGYVENGFQVRLSKGLFASGNIVYTTDGSDPRLPGGEPSPLAIAYTGPITLTESSTIKSRISNAGGWSALVEARFFVDLLPASPENLTISKVHYRPNAASEAEIAAGFSDRGDFEFLYVENIGDKTITLHDTRFVEGITFDFATSAITEVAAGAGVFVVSNLEAFKMRYGAEWPVAGTFSGNLSNDGERLLMVNRAGDVLQDLTYNDADPWPVEPDGNGPYLVLKASEKALPSEPTQWRASDTDEALGGFEPPSTEGIRYAAWAKDTFGDGLDSGLEGDPDGDGFINMIEFVFGMDPVRREHSLPLKLESDSNATLLEVPQRTPLLGVAVVLEVTDDLQQWHSVEANDVPLTSSPDPTNPSLLHKRFRIARANAAYYRFRVSTTGE